MGNDDAESKVLINQPAWRSRLSTDLLDSRLQHKDFLLISTAGATNLIGTPYSDDVTPVAPGGTLVAGVTAIVGTAFIDMLKPKELARFGLQNGGAFDETLISGKWECEPFLHSQSASDALATKPRHLSVRARPVSRRSPPKRLLPVLHVWSVLSLGLHALHFVS